MVKHTQTIRRQFADKLSVHHFVGLVLKRLSTILLQFLQSFLPPITYLEKKCVCWRVSDEVIFF